MSERTTGAWIGWSKPIDSLQNRIVRLANNSPTGEKRRELDRANIKLRLYESTLEKLLRWSADLYSGKPGLEFSADDSDELIQVVCSTLTGYVMRDAHRFLVRGLERGIRELGWRMPLPAPLTVTITESSNISPEAGERISQFDALESAFWRELESPGPMLDEATMTLDAGRLLYSAVAHSGLVSLWLLESLPASIQRGADLHENNIWLDLEKCDDEGGRVLLRRFFPAPVTQILLYRWYRKWGNKWPTINASSGENDTIVKHLLKPYVHRLCLMAGLPKGLSHNISSIAQADLAMTLPAAVLHFLRSRMLGIPVPRENWYRLLSGRQGLPNTPFISDNKGPVIQPLEVRSVSEFSDQHPLLEKMTETIRNVKAKAIAPELERYIKQKAVSPILQLMGHWAIKMVKYGGRKKDKLLAETIATYLNRISPLLDYADKFTDPFLLDADSWQEVYDSILGRSYGATSNRISALSDFHQFLERTYDIPPVDIGGIGGQSRVDARLLSPQEYYRVRRVLQSRTGKDRWAPVQELVLILGYRCGLRRNEALGRLFADFAGIDDPVLLDVRLLVRPNKNGRIKTEAGTRSLPLSTLLMDEELDRLKGFLLERKQLISGSPGMRAIFAEEVGGYRAMPQAQIFDPLTRLLNEVTGDGAFRFHHLRHTFVSLVLLRLVESWPGEHIPVEWRQDPEGNSLLPSMDGPLWQKIRMPGAGQAMWEMGMLAGHASPSISVHSYCHLLDWLTRSYLWQRKNPDLSIREQAALLGKSVAAIEKFRQRRGISGHHRLAGNLACTLAAEWPRVGRRVSPELRDFLSTELLASATMETHKLIGYRDAYDLMLATETLVPVGGGERAPRGLRAAAQLSGHDYDTALKWHCNALKAMSLRTNRERNSFDPSPEPPQANRSRLSTERAGVRRSIAEKDHQKGGVELESFIAPPKTPSTKVRAKHYFGRLMQWLIDEPELASESLRIVLNSIQRSKTRIKVRGAENQFKYYKLLCALRLKSRVGICVIVNDEMEALENKIVNYWMDWC